MLAQTQLRISRYQARTEMSPHQHDEPSMGIVVSGVFLERIGSDERTYSRGTASYCPAATTHSQVSARPACGRLSSNRIAAGLTISRTARRGWMRRRTRTQPHFATWATSCSEKCTKTTDFRRWLAKESCSRSSPRSAEKGQQRRPRRAPRLGFEQHANSCMRTHSCRSPWRRSRARQDVTRFIWRGNFVASSEFPWVPI